MKNQFKICDVVRCKRDEYQNEMVVIETDGKKIVGRYVDIDNKKIIETKGDFKLFERAI